MPLPMMALNCKEYFMDVRLLAFTGNSMALTLPPKHLMSHGCTTDSGVIRKKGMIVAPPRNSRALSALCSKTARVAVCALGSGGVQKLASREAAVDPGVIEAATSAASCAALKAPPAAGSIRDDR